MKQPQGVLNEMLATRGVIRRETESGASYEIPMPHLRKFSKDKLNTTMDKFALSLGRDLESTPYEEQVELNFTDEMRPVENGIDFGSVRNFEEATAFLRENYNPREKNRMLGIDEFTREVINGTPWVTDHTLEGRMAGYTRERFKEYDKREYDVEEAKEGLGAIAGVAGALGIFYYAYSPLSNAGEYLRESTENSTPVLEHLPSLMPFIAGVGVTGGLSILGGALVSQITTEGLDYVSDRFKDKIENEKNTEMQGYYCLSNCVEIYSNRKWSNLRSTRTSSGEDLIPDYNDKNRPTTSSFPSAMMGKTKINQDF